MAWGLSNLSNWALVVELFVLYSPQLNEVMDFRNSGVSKQMADTMHEWEGPVAEQLEADIAAIKIKHPGELKLQMYVTR